MGNACTPGLYPTLRSLNTWFGHKFTPFNLSSPHPVYTLVSMDSKVLSSNNHLQSTLLNSCLNTLLHSQKGNEARPVSIETITEFVEEAKGINVFEGDQKHNSRIQAA